MAQQRTWRIATTAVIVVAATVTSAIDGPDMERRHDADGVRRPASAVCLLPTLGLCNPTPA